MKRRAYNEGVVAGNYTALIRVSLSLFLSSHPLFLFLQPQAIVS